ncbi:hypothetical protein GCM10011380_00680 [Sphingomonas metalli]|uniref:Phage tail protein n=1 Tax=Sphingomonas metalli TaxID=1779358 RepID=A0A916SS81_9SPHN|nr:hypothetical protein [Sphingomonas metalli]GGB15131.1 hypothetical protein GCM10011380_00680 [Sphingomonas metalli]
MSYPTEIDAAVIRIGNGANTEVFEVACGIENVTVNETAGTTDRFRRDCAKPGQLPRRGIRVNNLSWDVTGSGVANADQLTKLKAALGQHKNYEIDAIRYDGTDAGDLLGTFAGQGVMTAKNLNLQTSGDSTMEITIAGENDLVWTPAT